MSLLPANATDTEKALEAASARLAEVPIPVATVGDAAEAPANVLPFLAWAKSVDVWDKTWSEATRRQVIAAAPAVHRVKGTPGSIEDAFTAAGYAVTIIERVGARRYDGGTAHNGLCLYGPDGGWAMYRIVVDQAVRNDHQTRRGDVTCSVSIIPKPQTFMTAPRFTTVSTTTELLNNGQ